MTAVERKRFVNKLDLAFRQLQVSGSRIFCGMLGSRGLGDREERWTPDQKAERDLARRRIVGRGDFAEYAACGCPQARKWRPNDRMGYSQRRATPCCSHQGMTACSIDRSFNGKGPDCTRALPSPAMLTASSRSSTSKLLTPHERILPSR